MDKPVIVNQLSPFEKFKQINENGEEFWSARDLKSILEYTEFRNLREVISKAMIACENSGFNPNHHFVGVTYMMEVGKGAKREVHEDLSTMDSIKKLERKRDKEQNSLPDKPKKH